VETNVTPGVNRRERLAFGAVGAVSALAVALRVVGAGAPLVFAAAAIAVAGLAWLLGIATEEAGEAVGPRLSSLLNATFGNAAELIIVVLAVREGLIDVAKASIIGSVIGNLLLVLGGSLLISGFRHGRLAFDTRVAGVNATMVVFAAVTLGLPTLIGSLPATSGHEERSVSFAVAVVMVAIYVMYLVATFRAPDEHGGLSTDAARWSVRTSLVVLSVTAAATGALSDLLVSAIRPTIAETGISPVFIGLIIVPVIGNVAEHLAAIRLAARGRLEFAVAISFNSALQVALAVSAVAVIAGAVFGSPVTLSFTPLEVALLATAALMSALIALSGTANWIEGAQLVALYAVAAIAVWWG
jgi:Ca2+:H+ antiporter